MQIEGEIVRVTFHNEENGYTVATLTHNGELTTIVGKFFSISCGENIRVTGEFVTNKNYGKQFSFTNYEVIYPTTIKGIKVFLGSGLIKGVREVTAENIVKKFGKNTLEIIEFQPQKLTEIKGISNNKAMTINESFHNYKNVHNIIIFLGQYGITTGMALKIYNVYKNRTIEQIQKNPYDLIENIDGIGFLTADRIGQKFGINKKSKFRIRAGILYSLKLASEKGGNTFLYFNDLLNKLISLLSLEKEILEEALKDILANLAIEKIIVISEKKEKKFIALYSFYLFEKFIAEKLAMINHSAISLTTDTAKDIDFFEKINKISFHSEQKNAIRTAIENNITIITGGPGTGKTTIIKCILSILKSQDKKTLLLAPTGRASKRMSDATGEEAKTIHRALAMDFETKKFYYNQHNLLDCDAVIIDEFSMVDVPLAYYLLSALPRDCKIIIVGDKDQLPSVGAGNVLDDIIKSKVIKTINLTQIFRQQKNSLIITNAHKINNGEMPIIDNHSRDFFFESKINQNDIADSIISLATTRLPNYIDLPTANIQILAPLKKGICGVENLNKRLQEKLNPPSIYKPELVVGTTIFRKGDRVMQTTNNYNLEWKQKISNREIINGTGVFNGDIGVIDDINYQNGEITVIFEGNKICVYPRTEINQLTLSYAITIHKSQGSEFDAVIIPIISGPSIILNRNLIYTAVTRAKNTVVIVGEKKNLNYMIKNKNILLRYTLLKNFLISADKKIATLFKE